MICGETMRKDKRGLQKPRRWSRIFGRASTRILSLIIQRSICLKISGLRPRGTDSRRGAPRREDWRRGGFSLDDSPVPSSGSSSNGQDLDEYEQWQRDIDSSDALITDPYEYWHMRRFQYPRLSRMASDLLTVPPMSAECERLFSTTGLMVTKSRNRLEASTIGLCQTLRSWLRAGLIGSLDRLLMEQ
jgi:hAT family C-terminal dimerisation region